MPLFYSQTIDANTRLAIWEIAEDEAFFLEKVPVSRQLTHPHKRLQHLAGRYLLQHLFPDFPLSLIQIADTRKPFLPEESHHFSISHCGNFAAAIVSTERRVGIDIEEPTERILRIMPKFMSERERNEFTPHNIELLVETATTLWSGKEAMYKWYGLGEVDFRQHLQIEGIAFINETSGMLQATFAKHRAQSLHLPFRWWPTLVLCWVSV
jgi:phosphopantetheinyl transferase